MPKKVRNFNATLARFKHSARVPSEMHRSHFNATLARFKRGFDLVFREEALQHFNATLARFKQGIVICHNL